MKIQQLVSTLVPFQFFQSFHYNIHRQFPVSHFITTIALFGVVLHANASPRLRRGEAITRRNAAIAIGEMEKHDPIPDEEQAHYKLGATAFMSMTYVRPGQQFYSFYNMQAKALQQMQLVDGVKRDSPARLVFRGDYSRYVRYNNGTSFLPMRDPAVGVLVKRWSRRRNRFIQSVILAGHHHHYLAGLLMGARTIPVYIVADLRHLNSWDQTMEELKKNRWIDEQDIAGRAVETKRFSEMSENNLRSVTDAVAYKVVFKDGAIASTQPPKNGEYPIYVKYSGGQLEATFDANQIARALHACGLDIPTDTSREALSSTQVEHIRGCLVQTRHHSSQALEGVDLFEKPIPVLDIDVVTIVKNRLAKITPCAALVSAPSSAQ